MGETAEKKTVESKNLYKLPDRTAFDLKIQSAIWSVREQLTQNLNFLRELDNFIIDCCCLVYTIKRRAYSDDPKSNAKDFRLTVNLLAIIHFGKKPRKRIKK